MFLFRPNNEGIMARPYIFRLRIDELNIEAGHQRCDDHVQFSVRETTAVSTISSVVSAEQWIK